MHYLLPSFTDAIFRDLVGEEYSLTAPVEGDDYTFTIDVPGIAPEHLHVEVKDGYLMVDGNDPDTKRQIRRAWRLAYPDAAIDAEAKHGLLTITIHRPDSAKGRKIEVR